MILLLVLNLVIQTTFVMIKTMISPRIMETHREYCKRDSTDNKPLGTSKVQEERLLLQVRRGMMRDGGLRGGLDHVVLRLI
jgi:hypothetical protein